MRKILFSLSVILLLCFSVNAQEYDYCAGAGGAVAGCNVGTSTLDESTFQAVLADTLIGNLSTAPCSGKLISASFHTHASTPNTKICVYLDDGDNTPDTGDALVECTSAITPIANQWVSGNFAGTADISASSKYWIMTITDGTGYIHAVSSGTAYTKAIAGSYTTPPATLEASFGTTGKTLMLYVTVE
jgi:hypothetical protein